MNPDKLLEVQARALRMAEWATGPDGLFAVFDAVEKNYAETFKSSGIEDSALREKVYHRIAALRDIRRALELVIAEGKGADAIIEKLSKMEEGRKKRSSQPRKTVNVA